MLLDQIKEYRLKFKKKDYFLHPRFDIVCITTLFTFEWKITIDTINFAKRLCRNPETVFVGGIASSIIPNEFVKETGIMPKTGKAIIGLHEYIAPLYEKYMCHPTRRKRIVDFNQGIDARLITPEKCVS